MFLLSSDRIHYIDQRKHDRQKYCADHDRGDYDHSRLNAAYFFIDGIVGFFRKASCDLLHGFLSVAAFCSGFKYSAFRNGEERRLPESVGQQKLSEYLLNRLKQIHISPKGIVVIGEYGYDGIDEVLRAIDLLRKGRNAVFIGTTNAGKSTLLNRIFADEKLTVSRYPGTTMDILEMPYQDYTIYDTPGFNQERSMQILANDRDMDYIIPKKQVKPQTFQLTSDQSLAIGGIARVDILGCKKASVTCYFANKLPVHRGKAADAEELWQKNRGKLLKPLIEGSYFQNRYTYRKKYTKTDIVIVGLGWLCISGDYRTVEVSGSDRMEVVFRKAMI